MEQEDHRNEGDDDRLLDQLLAQCCDRLFDKTGPIVAVDEAHTTGKRRCKRRHLRLDALDHREGILAVAHNDPAGDDLAFSVEIGDAAPNLRTDLHIRDVTDGDWRAPSADAEAHLANVIKGLKTPASSYHILAAAHLEDASSDVLVGAPHRVRHLGQRDVI